MTCRTVLMLAACSSLSLVPAKLRAQRPIGMPVPFYTTTGLLSADLEIGSLTSSTQQANAPRFTASLLLAAPLRKDTKRAWVVGLRGTPLMLSTLAPCQHAVGSSGCTNGPFNETVGLFTGGAFDIRRTVLRTMVGPTLYHVGGQGARVGTTVRIDWGSPRLRGSTPTLFFSRTFLGSQRGRSVQLSTLGAGFRWARKE